MNAKKAKALRKAAREVCVERDQPDAFRTIYRIMKKALK